MSGRLYLDDYERSDEQQIVRNWQRILPGISVVRVIATDYHLCVLEQRVTIEVPRVDSRVAIDVARQNLGRTASWAKQQVARVLVPSRSTV